MTPEVKDIEVRIALLEDHRERSLDHHKAQMRELSSIKDILSEVKQTLASLPCAVEEEKLKGFRKELNVMWFFVSAIILSLIYAGLSLVKDRGYQRDKVAVAENEPQNLQDRG